MARNKPGAKQDLIGSLATGMPGLDAVLGGGLPEYSFNLIAGAPGSGKTTLAQQLVFGAASAERPALYCTALGEPTLKMLRYQRQYEFFDPAMVGSAVHYRNMSDHAIAGGPAAVIAAIVEEVERLEPRVVVVDSFRSIEGLHQAGPKAGASIELLVQQLALSLTTWEVTSFLIGEYPENEPPNPVFTIADGVLRLSQVTDRNSVVRKLQVVKMRGRAPMPGLHTFRIASAGLQVFPRIPEQQQSRAPQQEGRHSTGVPGLDELMGGGIRIGDAVMVAGPTGSGKTTFAAQFISDAAGKGEAVVVAVFEEYPEEYLDRLQSREGIGDMHREGRLRIIYLRPLDLSVDETLNEILEAVDAIGATRVVIDSLSGFEVALAPGFREDFRESLYRLVGALTATGVTVYMTSEVITGYPELSFTNDRVSFITDDVISQRYVEIRGRLQKVLVVVKMRGSEHSSEFRTYELGPDGAVVGGPLSEYHGIMTGIPKLEPDHPPAEVRGLTDIEARVLEILVELGATTPEVLGTRVGMASADLAPVLDRLVAVGYAEATGKSAAKFRAVAR